MQEFLFILFEVGFIITLAYIYFRYQKKKILKIDRVELTDSVKSFLNKYQMPHQNDDELNFEDSLKILEENQSKIKEEDRSEYQELVNSLKFHLNSR